MTKVSESPWLPSLREGEAKGKSPHGPLEDPLKQRHLEREVLPEPRPIGREIARRIEQRRRFEAMAATIRDVETRLDQLEVARGVAASIQSLAPEPYRLLKPIPVVMHADGEEFSATFFDANISTCGDTPQEAFGNLRELILDIFDRLSSLPPDRLGPAPKKQLAILRDFIDVSDSNQRERSSDNPEA